MTRKTSFFFRFTLRFEIRKVHKEENLCLWSTPRARSTMEEQRWERNDILIWNRKILCFSFQHRVWILTIERSTDENRWSTDKFRLIVCKFERETANIRQTNRSIDNFEGIVQWSCSVDSLKRKTFSSLNKMKKKHSDRFVFYDWWNVVGILLNLRNQLFNRGFVGGRWRTHACWIRQAMRKMVNRLEMIFVMFVIRFCFRRFRSANLIGNEKKFHIAITRWFSLENHFRVVLKHYFSMIDDAFFWSYWPKRTYKRKRKLLFHALYFRQACCSQVLWF